MIGGVDRGPIQRSPLQQSSTLLGDFKPTLSLQSSLGTELTLLPPEVGRQVPTPAVWDLQGIVAGQCWKRDDALQRPLL